MASVYVLMLADGSVRVFDSFESMRDAPDIVTATELAGGHAVVTLRNGSVMAVRKVAFERLSPEITSPPPLQRCSSVASIGAGASLGNDEGASPLLAAAFFARTSPIGTSPLPESALLRTPERFKTGEPQCPGAPARILRVSPKRYREAAGESGARTAALLAEEEASLKAAGGKSAASGTPV